MTHSGSAARRIWRIICGTLTLGSALLLAGGLTSACQTSCGPGNQAPIPYVDGKTQTEGQSLIYETTARDGEWLHFPSNRRFLFKHNLGTTNYQIEAYLAFGSHPVPSDRDANADIALASGDILLIEQKNADSLLVRNDTCSDQYLYVMLTAPAAGSSAASLGDAGR